MFLSQVSPRGSRYTTLVAVCSVFIASMMFVFQASAKLNPPIYMDFEPVDPTALGQSIPVVLLVGHYEDCQDLSIVLEPIRGLSASRGLEWQANLVAEDTLKYRFEIYPSMQDTSGIRARVTCGQIRHYAELFFVPSDSGLVLFHGDPVYATERPPSRMKLVKEGYEPEWMPQELPGYQPSSTGSSVVTEPDPSPSSHVYPPPDEDAGPRSTSVSPAIRSMSDGQMERMLERSQLPLEDAEEEVFLIDGQVWARQKGESDFHIVQPVSDSDPNTATLIRDDHSPRDLVVRVETQELLDRLVADGLVPVALPDAPYYRVQLLKSQTAILSELHLPTAPFPRRPEPFDDESAETPKNPSPPMAPGDGTRDTIFFEGFEGAWPGSWSLGDDNSNSGYDYWGDVNCRSASDYWSGWCSDIGDMTDCDQHDNYMDAYIRSPGIDVSAYEDVQLHFDVWYETESCCDSLYRYYSSDGATWYKSATAYAGSSGGWDAETFNLNGFATYYVKWIFHSDYSVTYEGAYLDNITVSGTPVAVDEPNLRPYAPSGWDHPIVPSSVPGTNTVGTLFADQTTYIDWAVVNDGDADAGEFYTALYIDGDYVTRWRTSSLSVNYYASIEDYTRTLSSGWHELEIVADYLNEVDEEDESDNSYSRNFQWIDPSLPNLEPYAPSGWDYPVVPASIPGTNTVNTLYADQITYIDWCIKNTGDADAIEAFRTAIYIDDTLITYWNHSSGLSEGYISFIEDYEQTLMDGWHTLKIKTDYLNAVTESNEDDNEYIREFYWEPEGEVVVSGWIRYEDQRTGVAHDARWVDVEVWDEDLTSEDDLLWSGMTNEQGEFTSAAIPNSEPLQGQQDIYVKVFAKNEAAWITNQVSATYYLQTETEANVPNGPLWLGTLMPPPEGDGAWYIADNILTAKREWLEWRPENDPDDVQVSWPCLPIVNTSYDPYLNIIYIRGDNDASGWYPDTFDGDIVLHEYGHRLEDIGDFFDEGAGDHSWTQHISQELAASEGFAHTWSSFVRGDSRSYDRWNSFTEYHWVDVENGEHGYDWGTLGSATDQGSDCEAAVSGMFWDVLDTTDDDYDGDGVGDELDAEVDEFFNTALDRSVGGGHPDHSDEFWTAWFQSPSHGSLQQMWAIWYEHGDDKDTDDPITTITQPNSGGWFAADITLEADATDATSGIIEQVEFEYSLNHSTWADVFSSTHPGGIDTNGDDGWAIEFTTIGTPSHGDINDATVWVRARATDLSGNIGDWDECNDSFSVDNQAPTFSTWNNTGDPEPGPYFMEQGIADDGVGVLDNDTYPAFYFRWNNDSIDESNYSGVMVGSLVGEYYQAGFTVLEANEGDHIYWRVRAQDQLGHEDWSAVHDGGIIGDDDTEGPVLSNFADSEDQEPGPYGFYVDAVDPEGVLDDNEFPKVYYRYNSSTIDESNNDGWVNLDHTSENGYYGEEEIGTDHIGDTIYWRVLAWDEDNSPASSWSGVQEGGQILSLPEDIHVTVPSGGEQWEVGSTQQIQWISQHIDNVGIEFGDGEDSWTLIVPSYPAVGGSYSWEIPNSPGPWKIRVCDADDQEPCDVSNGVFEIYVSAPCCVNEVCSMSSEGDCATQGGTWNPEYESCSPNPCPHAPPRVCCVDEICTLQDSEFDCATAGGVWHPEWESCDPVNPCDVAILIVHADGSGPYPTIQAAVDAATSGQVVVLSDGVFSGSGNRDIDYQGKDITIRSQSNDPTLCTIDCEGTAGDPHRGVVFGSGEGPEAVLMGITIRNGYCLPADYGSAVRCTGGSSPTISNCVFVNNFGDGAAGMYCIGAGSTPTLENCVFRSNSVDHNGGAIHVGGNASVSISYTTFSENSAPGNGGALYVAGDAIATLTHCTFSGNSAPASGAISCYSGSALLENCIVAFTVSGCAAHCTNGGVLDFNCGNVYDNDGGNWVGCLVGQETEPGNISVDPLFCDPTTGNLTLRSDSPCAQENNQECGQVGAWPIGCDAACACCIDSNCQLMTEVDCSEAQGAWLEGTDTCDPNPCQQGACCFADGSCQNLTEIDCANQPGYGDWLGPAVLCSSDPCSPRTTWYVAVDGDDSASGTFDRPLATIQEAINRSADGDTVQASEGTFSGLGNYDLSTLGKAILVRGASTGGSTIDCVGVHEGFNFVEGENTATRVVDLTIENATTAFRSELSSVSLRNVVVQNSNTGLMSRWGAMPVLTNSTFANLQHGIVTEEGGGFTADSCTFATMAVGVRSGDTTAQLNKCTFANTDQAVDAEQSVSLPITKCTFLNNALVAMGGVIMDSCTVEGGVDGIGAYQDYVPGMQYVVSNTSFTGLTGTVLLGADQVTVTNCTIEDNSGSIMSGSSVEETYIHAHLGNCSMKNNGGGINLGGVDIYLSMANCLYANNAGGVNYDCYYRGSVALASNTIVETGGGAIAIYCPDGTVSLSRNVIAFNDGAGIHISDGSYGISCNDVYGNIGGEYSGIPDQTGLNDNISLDPMMCDPEAGNYGLWSTSPCAPFSPPNDACDLIGAFPVACYDLYACCIDESCQMLSEDDCQVAGGVWLEGIASCDPDPCVPQTYLVASDGSGDFPTIQSAVNASADGDTIVLSDGTFQGAGNCNVSFDGKAIVVRSVCGDPALCMIDCENAARGFVFTNGEGVNAVLQGVSIANAEVDGCGGAVLCDQGSTPTIRNVVFENCTAIGDDGHGGGLGVRGGSGPFLEQCSFVGNEAVEAGGGIYSPGGSTTAIQSCHFENNATQQEGGGVFGTFAQLDDCTFVSNQASERGGGAYLTDGSQSLVISSCVFQGDMAGGHGGGVYLAGNQQECEIVDCIFSGCASVSAKGGGVFASGLGPSTIAGCEFESCTAGGEGGGLRVESTMVDTLVVDDCSFTDCVTDDHGGGAFINGTVTIRHTTFTGNRSAYSAGALYLREGGNLLNCTFTGNEALAEAGALKFHESDTTSVGGCRFSGNHAQTDGGGIVLSGVSNPAFSECGFYRNVAQGRGGALFSDDAAQPSIVSCTFAADSCGSGQGTALATASVVNAANTIFAFGEGGTAVHVESAGEVIVSCCDVFENEGGAGAVEGQIGEQGNIAEDPCFCDLESGWLSLEEYSPCSGEENPSCGQIGAYPVECATVLPDLWVSAILYLPTRQIDGRIGGIGAVLRNQGDGDAEACQIYFGVDGDSIACIELADGLSAGADTFVIFEDWMSALGPHDIHVVADWLDEVDESNEGNNELLATKSLPYPDLRVRDLHWTSVEPEPGTGDTLVIWAEVVNAGGGGNITDYVVDFEVVEEGSPATLSVEMRNDISLGQSATAFENAGFELGSWAGWESNSAWVIEPHPGDPDSTGNRYWLRGNDNSGAVLRSQPFAVNDSVLTFRGSAYSEQYSSTLSIVDEESGVTLESVIFHGVNDENHSDWQTYALDMSAHMGATVRVKATLPENWAGAVGLDDVRIGSGNEEVLVGFASIDWVLEHSLDQSNLQVTAIADAEDVIVESDESNNECTEGIEYTSSTQHTEGTCERLYLNANHPNPFQRQTIIRFGVAARGRVSLQVFDVSGRLVATLVGGDMREGHYEIEWNGRSAQGAALESGVYLYRLEANGERITRTMTLLR